MYFRYYIQQISEIASANSIHSVVLHEIAFFNIIMISSRSESLALNSFNIFQRIHSIQIQHIHLNWESNTSVFLIDIINNFRNI